MKYKNILLILIAFIFTFSLRPAYASHLNDGALIKASGPEVYFIENGLKRWIVDPDVFSELEFDWSKIQTVSDNEISFYPKGDVLKNGNRYPEKTLLRVKGDDKVYLIDGFYRRWVKTENDFINLGLSWNNIFDISEKKMKSIRERSPVSGIVKDFYPRVFFEYYPELVVEDFKVKFAFNAISGLTENRGVIFETFLDGVDKKWVKTTRKERNFVLSKKSLNYTFFVRARYKNSSIYSPIIKREFSVRLSPYFNDLKIKGISLASLDFRKEQILITNRSRKNYNLKSWTLSSSKKNISYEIPKVSDIPRYFGFNDKKDVVLPPGGRVFVFSKISPSGFNIRENVCTGYLNNDYVFYPELKKSCPVIKDYKMSDLNDYCRSSIRSLSNCQLPNTNDIAISNECRAFMFENLSYASCVRNNKDLYDFYKNDWRVYLKSKKKIWSEKNDTIYLRDENGLVVDYYTY